MTTDTVIKKKRHSKLKRVPEGLAKEAKKLFKQELQNKPEFVEIIVTKFHIFNDRRKLVYHRDSLCLMVVLKKFLGIASLRDSRGKNLTELINTAWPDSIRGVPVVYAVMGKFRDIAAATKTSQS